MNFGITYKPPSPTPINILWAETYYDLVDYGENKNSDIIWKSKSYKLPYLNAFLRFQYQQLTNKHIRLTCARIVPLGPNSRLDYRYTLQFHCSITLDDTDPLVFHMLGTQTEADGSFHLKCDCNCNQFDSKIVVSVIEHEIFKTDVYFRQEKDFREMKEQYFNSETVLNYLGCILNCPGVQDIFTGKYTPCIFN